MKIILQENVVKLGKAGDVVEAKPGYFRNFLEPKNLAVVASAGALKKREQELEVLRKKAEKAHQENVALVEKITELGSINILVKSGEGGKLYGKVTNKEIADTFGKALGIDIDKRIVKPGGDISTLGSYTATIRFTAEVHTEITVQVSPENTGAPSPQKSSGR